MFIWLVILALFVVAAILFAIDPRRLRVGIVTFSALSLTVLAVVAFVFDKLSSPTNEAAAWFLLGLIAIALLTIVSLAAFLVYTGILMLLRESRKFQNLLALLLGLALLGYVALGFLALYLNSEGIMIWILFSIPPIGYLGFVFASFLLYAWLYGIWVRRRGGPVSSVIVLGAGLAGDRVTPLLASRLTLGKTIFDMSRAAGRPSRIIVSGGKGADEQVSEAEAMAAWLADAGVPVSDILREDRSTTTEENIRYSMELMEDQGTPETSAVVTNNYHAFRAATLMSRLRMPGYARGSATARYFWPTATIREFIALLRDHLRLNAIILGILCVPLLAYLFTFLAR